MAEVEPPVEPAGSAPDLALAKLTRASAVARGRSGGASPARRRSTAPRLSGSRPDGRDPAPVGDVLRRWLDDRGWQEDAAIGALTGRWPEIVGPEFADHVTPEFTEADGERVCLLRADSTAWATQVRLLVPQIHRRLDEALGDGVVQRIRVVGPAPPPRTGALRVPGPGPRDTYG